MGREVCQNARLRRKERRKKKREERNLVEGDEGGLADQKGKRGLPTVWFNQGGGGLVGAKLPS